MRDNKSIFQCDCGLSLWFSSSLVIKVSVLLVSVRIGAGSEILFSFLNRNKKTAGYRLAVTQPSGQTAAPDHFAFDQLEIQMESA